MTAADVRVAAERSYWRWVWVAVVLSPRIEICEALLRGESVPLSRLDAEWVRRLGWRGR